VYGFWNRKAFDLHHRQVNSMEAMTSLFNLKRNGSTNVRYALEALAKFRIDATALRRGSSRSQLRQTAPRSVLRLHGLAPRSLTSMDANDLRRHQEKS